MKPIILTGICLLLTVYTLRGQLPKGDRILGWHIDMAENNKYDSAFMYAAFACMESVHFTFTWSEIEPRINNYNPEFIEYLDIINIYYPQFGIKTELQISPINTNRLEVPEELTDINFDNPEMIARFKKLLDTVFSHIGNVEIVALDIGNESDVYLGTNSEQYRQLGTFLDSVTPHAQHLYKQLHDEELKVGTTFTFEGLTDPAKGPLCKQVNQNRDIVAVTYYPLDHGFIMKPPEVVIPDIERLIDWYPDDSKPVYFVEIGYSTSKLCNSNEEKQARFYQYVFKAWDTFYDHIKYLTIFKLTDWSQETVEAMGQYYGLNNPAFLEYLRTLGVRTWAGNGTNKLAYYQIVHELESRSWCSFSSADENLAIRPKICTPVVFPNPAKGVAMLFFGNNNENRYILKLFDNNGKRIRTIHQENPRFIIIERKGLEKGTYFYQLTTNHKIVNTGKLQFM
ncbi:MAG: T9SS type A sorting domain-containing protein [Prolixibacteraceae bacterium]|nr:T9SS type A sorting domain-containing protein [Prolixibacteraceae bacterium]